MAARTDSARSHTGAWLALAGTGVLALVALMSVLRARYDAGESYPEYSSLRADPQGTRVLFESLGQVPGVETARNFERLDKVQGSPRQALLLCGLDARAFASYGMVDGQALARFAGSGGRLIIALNPATDMGRITRALHSAIEETDKEDQEEEKARKADEEKKKKEKAKAAPETSQPKADKSKSDKPKDGKPAEKSKQKAKDKEKKKHRLHDEEPLAASLKVSAKAVAFYFSDKGGSPVKLAPGTSLAADDTPLWFSNVYLNDDPAQDWQAEWGELAKVVERRLGRDEHGDKPGEEKPEKKKKADKPVEPSPWRTIATKGGRPMIMERKLGSGSVVVCTDRYFLSNEALWKGPSTAFLSWLFGDATRITFEETHLGPGIGDEDGVMTLARRYRMHGLFLGGILLFGLFIWRNSLSLVPPNPEDDLGHWRADAVAGQSTASGLEGLLRRGVGHSKLLARCLDVWEGTKAAATAIPAERRAKARALLATFKTRQAPQAYREMRDLLHPPGSRASNPQSPTHRP